MAVGSAEAKLKPRSVTEEPDEEAVLAPRLYDTVGASYENPFARLPRLPFTFVTMSKFSPAPLAGRHEIAVREAHDSVAQVEDPSVTLMVTSVTPKLKPDSVTDELDELGTLVLATTVIAAAS